MAFAIPSRWRTCRLVVSEKPWIQWLVGRRLLIIPSTTSHLHRRPARLAACDEEAARLLKGFADKVDVVAQPLPVNTLKHNAQQKNAPRFEAREELYRTCGVDLTQVSGIQTNTALVLLAELGPDFADRFPSAKHFSSWLGLCPDNRITGGKIMSSTTRDVKSRAATALRFPRIVNVPAEGRMTLPTTMGL